MNTNTHRSDRFLKLCTIIFLTIIPLNTQSQISGFDPRPPSSDSFRDLDPVKELHGLYNSETDLPGWFADISEWGVERWVQHAPHSMMPATMKTIAFLGDLDQKYTAFINEEHARWQEDHLLKVQDQCRKYGMEFHYILPFPIFPVQDMEVVKKVHPELFNEEGLLDLSNPVIPELLKEELRAYKEAMPYLSGFELWLGVEGGGMYTASRTELFKFKSWGPAIIRAFNDVCKELGVEGRIFPHSYRHTVGTRSETYRVLSEFSDLVILEDITWPEETATMPFLGYLPDAEKRMLHSNWSVAYNFLTDTEYIGLGVFPGVMTEWWKKNVQEAYRIEAGCIRGRVFFCDKGKTDVSFNRLNAYILMRFAENPHLDTREVLADAAKEAFGKDIPERLVEILKSTEPIIEEVTSINCMNPLNHTRFPLGVHLDRGYWDIDLTMKAVDDLFAPPGTPLYSPLTNSLGAGKQWRWQRRTVSESYEHYRASKDASIQWLEKILPEVEKLSSGLYPEHHELFVTGYRTLLNYALAMRIFVDVSKLHHDWKHKGTLSTETMRNKMDELAYELTELAVKSEDLPLNFSNDIKSFVSFIQEL